VFPKTNPCPRELLRENIRVPQTFANKAFLLNFLKERPFSSGLVVNEVVVTNLRVETTI